MTGRNKVVYVTSDSSHWVIMDTPVGFISPPTMELHVPMQGACTFYYASCYQLRVPDEAKSAAGEQMV